MTRGRSRAGHWRTNLKGEAAFDSFVPTDLQDVHLSYDADLAGKLAEAEFALGNLREAYASLGEEERGAAAQALLAREASASWKLSSDRAPEMLLFGNVDSGAPPLDIGMLLHSPEDRKEIEDLKEAMGYAMEPFDGLPISRRLLSRAHFLATQGRRYEKKYPGEVRRSPNWMGKPGASLLQAKFVFPTGDDLERALSRLEQYIHDEGPHPELVKVVLAHYQFEVVHPFIDANGRIGRMLTNLMLIEAKRIPLLAFPLSDALRTRASEYYGLLERVEIEGDYEGWVLFFLGVIQQAAEQALRSRHHQQATPRS